MSDSTDGRERGITVSGKLTPSKPMATPRESINRKLNARAKTIEEITKYLRDGRIQDATERADTSTTKRLVSAAKELMEAAWMLDAIQGGGQ